MKKYFLIFLLLAFFVGPTIGLAEESSSQAKIDVKMGDFSYDQGPNAPFVHAGPNAGYMQIYSWPINNGEGYAYLYDVSLDGMTVKELANLSYGIKSKIKVYPISRVPENQDPPKLLPSPPPDMRFLGVFKIKGGLDQPYKPIVAKGMLAAKLNTNARFMCLKVKFKPRPTLTGLAIGSGVAKEISNTTAATVAPILGRSWGETYTISAVEVEAYGGNKTISDYGYKPQTSKPQASAAPQPTAKSGTTAVPAEKPQKNLKIISDLRPIYFDFNVDKPQAGQEAEMKRWAIWLAPKLGWLIKFHRQVEFQGHCDERGGENYNAGLGLRRSVNVQNIVVGMLINSGKDEKERQQIADACSLIFRANSAGKHQPDFADAKKLGIAKQEMHQLNRRVDLVIVDQNLTLSNAVKSTMKGVEK